MDNTGFVHLIQDVMSNTHTSKQQLCSSLNLQKEQIANVLAGMDNVSMSLCLQIIRSMNHCVVLRPSSRMCYRICYYNDLVQILQDVFPQSGSFRDLTLKKFLFFVSDWGVNLEAHKYIAPPITRPIKRKLHPVKQKSANIIVAVNKSHKEHAIPSNDTNMISLLLEGKRGRRFEGDFRCTCCGEPANKGMSYSTTEGLITVCYTCRGKLKSVTRTSIIYNAVESNRKKY